jgi:hypothetical protein
MQNKIDTKGYIIRGLRKAVKQISEAVNRRELYFIYYDLETRTVEVNAPAGYSDKKLLIMESGVYKLTQQEIADIIVDKLSKLRYI